MSDGAWTINTPLARAVAIVIWLLAAFTVLLLGSGVKWLPPLISHHGVEFDRQLQVTLYVVGIAFVAAQAALGFVVWRYGAIANGLQRVAFHTRGSKGLEIAWTVATCVVFVLLAALGQKAWTRMRLQERAVNSIQIEVMAQQFQWNFRYPGVDKVFGRTASQFVDDANLNFVGLDESDSRAADDTVVSTLLIPINQPVTLVMRARDVTHSLWVPPLRLKQDLVPGLQTRVNFVATRIGKYEIACAELCGALHYNMKSFLLVLPESDFRELTQLSGRAFQRRTRELLERYALKLADDFGKL